jgi:putative intracellular protease/amidase
VVDVLAAGRGTTDDARMRVGVLLYDGVDLLDASGPYEVFLTATRLAVRDGRTARQIDYDWDPSPAHVGP